MEEESEARRRLRRQLAQLGKELARQLERLRRSERGDADAREGVDPDPRPDQS